MKRAMSRKIEHNMMSDRDYHLQVKKFILSADFFKELEKNENARHFYLENSTVRTLVNLMRTKENFFQQHLSTQAFVQFINIYAPDNARNRIQTHLILKSWRSTTLFQ